MTTLILVGLIGGFITGISPCVLPVLPVVFLSGAARADGGATPRSARPYLIVAGLALSFSAVTLAGTLVVQALPIPDDTIRWAGLVALLLIGAAMLIPSLERLLERPFQRIRVGNGGRGRSGFVLGLALGAVYVPCAGPVLAAITVAGATGMIGSRTIALTAAFAVGTALPLLGFALAGDRVTGRVAAFRRRQRSIRAVAGLVMILLAVALTFNVTDALQRAVPDYTSAFNRSLDKHSTDVLTARSDDALSRCVDTHDDALVDCGEAPAIDGIDAWLNTPGGAAVNPSGKVTLVDFWAYSCINCQRAIPHVEAWYQTYARAGLTVIGVHTPEYAFEHDPGNIAAGARRLNITYPIAVDNSYVTWTNYANKAWPATFLIDASGRVRHVNVGEGNYDRTENLIRQLLRAAHPSATLPPPTKTPNNTPTNPLQTAETYLGSERERMYAGGTLTNGTHVFSYPSTALINTFALTGTWTVSAESLTAGADAGIELRYVAATVYLDVGGTGSLDVSPLELSGESTGLPHTVPISGPPNLVPLTSSDAPQPGRIRLAVTPGLQLYSFTYG